MLSFFKFYECTCMYYLWIHNWKTCTHVQVHKHVFMIFESVTKTILISVSFNPVFNDGKRKELICIDGTIPVLYKGLYEVLPDIINIYVDPEICFSMGYTSGISSGNILILFQIYQTKIVHQKINNLKCSKIDFRVNISNRNEIKQQ